jgi:hypothetical protein
LKCIQTPPPGTIAGAQQSAPTIPYFGTDRMLPRWPHHPHTSPPWSTTRDTSPTPAAPPIKGAPSPPRPFPFPLSSSLMSARSSNLPPPPLFPWPRVHASQPDCRRHAVFTPLSPCPRPLGELHRAPVVHPVWTVSHLPRPLLQLQDSLTPSPATRAPSPPYNAIAPSHFLCPTTVSHL